MEKPLNYQITKRKEELYNFYYKGIGDRIKKRRIELNYTQESLAHGICSNTYISKIENNRVVPNQEQLMLIMEKIGIGIEEIGVPESIVDYLEKSLECFFFKDVEGYAEIIKRVEHLDFSVLVYIIRLGYYVLTENNEDAKIYYDEVSRYYNSLEEFGFATCMIYGCFYNVNICNFKTARTVLDRVQKRLRNDEMLFSLYSLLNYIVYGNLHLPNSTLIHLNIAETIFSKRGNLARTAEVQMYINKFRAIEGTSDDITFNKAHLALLTKKQRNNYLLLLGIMSNSGEKYIELIDKDSESYRKAIFVKAINYIKEEKEDEYLKMKERLHMCNKNYTFENDYIQHLKMYESKDDRMIREHLINYGLPYMIKTQNILMIKSIGVELETIFSNRNRYKDAVTYNKKCRNIIKDLQQKAKID
ncbi:MAG: helix-turn-helix transcriptional regulator [Tenericutes bacterium]|nr:helix-turn-helix transcriptional regulator [Mycoplasmatota bacterium]